MRNAKRNKASTENPASFVTNAATFSLTRAMQRLWTDHVVWTRHYVIAAVDERPELDAATTRLLKNQEDIGNAVVPLYGKAAGKQLTDLLKQHILIAVDLVAAAKAGDQKKFQTFDKKWEDNAEQIATFLSDANPYLTKRDVVDLLHLHLSLTKDEAVARIKKDFKKDAAVFDQILTEILTLSDALSHAIIKQFSSKFAA
jgi:hypothetical protein